MQPQPQPLLRPHRLKLLRLNKPDFQQEKLRRSSNRRSFFIAISN
jgi:hypothetical protein